jgi:hypothetical protein
MMVPHVPTEVTLTRDDLAAPRFTPRELRQIKDTFGRSFGQLLADEDTDDKFAALAWIKLRRLDHQVSLEEMDDVVITVNPGLVTPVDPTTEGSSTGSPPSAGTGE